MDVSMKEELENENVILMLYSSCKVSEIFLSRLQTSPNDVIRYDPKFLADLVIHEVSQWVIELGC